MDDLSGADVERPTARMAESLGLGQIGFAAAEGLVRLRQLRGALDDQSLQIVLHQMECLLCLPAHGDLALQLHVLPGKLLKHAVDGARQRVECVRSTVRWHTTCEIAFDDGGRRAADFLHLEQQRPTNHPPDDRTQDHNDAYGAGDPVPEAFDKRLEADALAAHQEVVSAR